MKRSVLFGLVLAGMSVVAIGRAGAASAVATDFHGHTVYSKGQASKAVAIHNALEWARLRYGAGVRIVAATDATGYGAIAVGGKGNNQSVLGVTLGQPSRAEAERRAVELCLRAGGTEPKVRWEWHG